MNYESELSKHLDKITELKLVAVHIGLEEKTAEKNPNFPSVSNQKYLQDNWSVTISYKGKSFTTNYWQGIGYRELVRPVRKEGNRYWHPIYGGYKNEKDACEAHWLKLVPPKLADVMHCLLSDASGVEDTFENWCGNFGYNIDSRKALDIYLKCQEIRDHMLNLLGYELFQELSRLEH